MPTTSERWGGFSADPLDTTLGDWLWSLLPMTLVALALLLASGCAAPAREHAVLDRVDLEEWTDAELRALVESEREDASQAGGPR